MIFPLVCKNGHRWEVQCAVADKPKTCRCGAECETDLAACNIAGVVKGSKVVFDKHTSVTNWHHKADAARMAEELGPIGKKCIQPDGTVRFLDRRDQSKYQAAKARYEARQRERAADVEMHERAEVKRGNMIEVPETVPFGGIKKDRAAKSNRKVQRNPRLLTRRNKR